MKTEDYRAGLESVRQSGDYRPLLLSLFKRGINRIVIGEDALGCAHAFLAAYGTGGSIVPKEHDSDSANLVSDATNNRPSYVLTIEAPRKENQQRIAR